MQKIFVDKTNISAFKKMIKEISESENNIIIVPDKFSLNSEQLFFEENNLTVSFSTQTFSLTKLASKILEKKLVDKKIIDKNISVMIISSILQENLDKLNYFKNIKDINQFSLDVYNFISQIQSSKIESFNENINENLKNKIHDLNLIYNEYIKKQKDYLIDSSFKFDLFLDEIKNSDLIKQTNFYFGMFNNLTNQVKKIIKEIAKYAKSVNFSASFLENKVNNNEIFEFYKSLDKNSKLIESNSLGSVQNFIISNFFGTKNEVFDVKDNKIVLFEAKNIEDEVLNVVYEIKKDIILNNLRFKDIAICVSSLQKYSSIIKEEFSKTFFTFFIDDSSMLESFGYSRFVLGVLKMIKNLDVKTFVDILKSGYVLFDSDKIDNFENFVKKIDLKEFLDKNKLACFKNENGYEDYFEIKDKLLKPFQNFKNNYKNWDIREFFNNINLIFETFGAKKILEKKIDIEKNRDILKYKNLCQIEEKVQNCFENIIDYYNEKVDIDKIYYFVKLCFENVGVSNPPASVDAIFVGDSVNSYFKNYKKLYYIGLDSNSIGVMSDDALLSENELKLLEKDVEINPKPSLVNKLNYYKCFENLLCFTDSLVLSYSVTSGGTQCYPSLILKNFLRYMTKNNEKISFLKVDVDILNKFNENEIVSLLGLKFNNFQDIIKNYYTQESGILKNVLKQITIDKTNWLFEKEENNIDKDLINMASFSASSLEDYFACSKKYFYRDYLKLIPFKKLDFDAIVVGNIVHECAKSFADNLNKKEEIENLKEKVFESVIGKEKYKFIGVIPNFNAKLLNLKQEVFKLFDFIEKQQSESEFKITKTEYGFIEDFDDFKLKGFIDRIDENENEFIIVDYKTGSTKMEYSDIVLCKKVQLLLYAKVLEKKLNKNCVGVYYLTIKDDFTKENKQKIYFNGLTVNENNNLYRLFKGDRIFDDNEKYLLSRKQFDKLKDYVFLKVRNAILDIKNAKFKENPIKMDDFSECEYCDYNEICLNKKEKIIDFDEEMLKEIIDD